MLTPEQLNAYLAAGIQETTDAAELGALCQGLAAQWVDGATFPEAGRRLGALAGTQPGCGICWYHDANAATRRVGEHSQRGLIAEVVPWGAQPNDIYEAALRVQAGEVKVVYLPVHVLGEPETLQQVGHLAANPGISSAVYDGTLFGDATYFEQMAAYFEASLAQLPATFVGRVSFGHGAAPVAPEPATAPGGADTAAGTAPGLDGDQVPGGQVVSPEEMNALLGVGGEEVGVGAGDSIDTLSRILERGGDEAMDADSLSRILERGDGAEESTADTLSTILERSSDAGIAMDGEMDADTLSSILDRSDTAPGVEASGNDTLSGILERGDDQDGESLSRILERGEEPVEVASAISDIADGDIDADSLSRILGGEQEPAAPAATPPAGGGEMDVESLSRILDRGDADASQLSGITDGDMDAETLSRILERGDEGASQESDVETLSRILERGGDLEAANADMDVETLSSILDRGGNDDLAGIVAAVPDGAEAPPDTGTLSGILVAAPRSDVLAPPSASLSGISLAAPVTEPEAEVPAPSLDTGTLSGILGGGDQGESDVETLSTILDRGADGPSDAAGLDPGTLSGILGGGDQGDPEVETLSTILDRGDADGPDLDPGTLSGILGGGDQGSSDLETLSRILERGEEGARAPGDGVSDPFGVLEDAPPEAGRQELAAAFGQIAGEDPSDLSALGVMDGSARPEPEPGEVSRMLLPEEADDLAVAPAPELEEPSVEVSVIQADGDLDLGDLMAAPPIEEAPPELSVDLEDALGALAAESGTERPEQAQGEVSRMILPEELGALEGQFEEMSATASAAPAAAEEELLDAPALEGLDFGEDDALDALVAMTGDERPEPAPGEISRALLPGEEVADLAGAGEISVDDGEDAAPVADLVDAFDSLGALTVGGSSERPEQADGEVSRMILPEELEDLVAAPVGAEDLGAPEPARDPDTISGVFGDDDAETETVSGIFGNDEIEAETVSGVFGEEEREPATISGVFGDEDHTPETVSGVFADEPNAAETLSDLLDETSSGIGDIGVFADDSGVYTEAETRAAEGLTPAPGLAVEPPAPAAAVDDLENALGMLAGTTGTARPEQADGEVSRMLLPDDLAALDSGDPGETLSGILGSSGEAEPAPLSSILPEGALDGDTLSGILGEAPSGDSLSGLFPGEGSGAETLSGVLETGGSGGGETLSGLLDPVEAGGGETLSGLLEPPAMVDDLDLAGGSDTLSGIFGDETGGPEPETLSQILDDSIDPAALLEPPALAEPDPLGDMFSNLAPGQEFEVRSEVAPIVPAPAVDSAPAEPFDPMALEDGLAAFASAPQINQPKQAPGSVTRLIMGEGEGGGGAPGIDASGLEESLAALVGPEEGGAAEGAGPDLDALMGFESPDLQAVDLGSGGPGPAGGPLATRPGEVRIPDAGDPNLHTRPGEVRIPEPPETGNEGLDDSSGDVADIVGLDFSSADFGRPAGLETAAGEARIPDFDPGGIDSEDSLVAALGDLSPGTMPEFADAPGFEMGFPDPAPADPLEPPVVEDAGDPLDQLLAAAGPVSEPAPVADPTPEEEIDPLDQLLAATGGLPAEPPRGPEPSPELKDALDDALGEVGFPDVPAAAADTNDAVEALLAEVEEIEVPGLVPDFGEELSAPPPAPEPEVAPEPEPAAAAPSGGAPLDLDTLFASEAPPPAPASEPPAPGVGREEELASVPPPAPATAPRSEPVTAPRRKVTEIFDLPAPLLQVYEGAGGDLRKVSAALREILDVAESGDEDAGVWEQLDTILDVARSFPGDKVARYAEGVVHLHRNRRFDGIGALRRAAELARTEGDLFGLGFLLEDLADRMPDDPGVGEALADHYLETNRQEDARKVFGRLGDVTLELGNVRDALRYLEKAYALDPGSSRSAAGLLRALHAQGAEARALEVANDFLSTRPGAPAILAHQGVALERLARPEQARESFEKAFEKAWDSVPRLEELFTELRVTGMDELRQRAETRILDLEPQNAVVAEARGLAAEAAALEQGVARVEPPPADDLDAIFGTTPVLESIPGRASAAEEIVRPVGDVFGRALAVAPKFRRQVTELERLAQDLLGGEQDGISVDDAHLADLLRRFLAASELLERVDPEVARDLLEEGRVFMRQFEDPTLLFLWKEQLEAQIQALRPEARASAA